MSDIVHDSTADLATSSTTTSTTTTTNAVAVEIDDEYPVDRRKATMLLCLTAEQRYALYNEWSPYDVESWYTALSRHTFASVFLPLPVDVARCFVKPQREFTAEDLDLLKSFGQQVHNTMLSLPRSPKKSIRAFVRLNSRSPKDAVSLESKRMQRYLENALMKFNADQPNADKYADRNHTTIALRSTFAQACSVTSGSDAVSILYASERISTDIQMAFEFIDRRWPLQVVIREWQDIPLAFEMRGFVYNGQLNALSQYNHDCYFEELVARRHEVEHQIREFWERLKTEGNFPFRHAVVDFGLLPTSKPDEYRVVIIECNPFDAYTGPGLFDWENDRDWEVLTKGPFEMRIIQDTESCRRAQKALFWCWKTEIEAAKRRVAARRQKQTQLKGLLALVGAAVAVGVIAYAVNRNNTN